ncbi:MAG: ATP-binding protein [Phycisphaerae bacterium]
MYPRHITKNLLAALRDTPVVVLHGARQTGKTTLARQLAESDHPANYVTLDQASALATLTRDPQGFVDELEGPVILDEIQRAPEIMLAIKAAVDRDHKPGRFLLTGSAHVLHLPKLADSLAGRMEVLTLRPLSQGELGGVREGFVDAVFAAKLPPWTARARAKSIAALKRDLAARILAGGYPEAVARKDRDRRSQWFESYLSSILMRDVKDLSNITGLAEMPRLMIAIAGRAGGLLNHSELGRDVGLNNVTVKRYLALLAATFIVQTIRPWFSNRIKRVVKSEKIYLADSGLLAHVLDASPDSFSADPKMAGMLLENFVAVELMKQASWSRTRPSIWHFRDHRGHEVDFVLESPGGRKIVGIEVKSAATLKSADSQGLRVLSEAAGDRFHRGIVLYGGQEIMPLGRNLRALPISALWQLGAQPAS